MEENFDRVVGLVVNEEVNEMLPPDQHPPLIDNKGHEVILPEQGQELVGQGHFVALPPFCNVLCCCCDLFTHFKSISGTER